MSLVCVILCASVACLSFSILFSQSTLVLQYGQFVLVLFVSAFCLCLESAVKVLANFIFYLLRGHRITHSGLMTEIEQSDSVKQEFRHEPTRAHYQK